MSDTETGYTPDEQEELEDYGNRPDLDGEGQEDTPAELVAGDDA